MATVYIGIGSNLGDRHIFIEDSLLRLERDVGNIVTRSTVIETEPWGFDSADSFLNMVTKIETLLSPGGLLESLLKIESDMGRIRSEPGYRSRVIDLDILFYDDLIIDSGDLAIPHPLLHRRLFVLQPMSEIAPDLVHPVLNKSISELLCELEGC
ncbi:MAG: 2-amino-4-hydroxy-6-hydroxymethyldihydropteridine diphosphokinase [Bacteroidia bacterium]|nr:MAG: 2-amino-4-hydroxy-6-hydroxymethyldihydropteridine diphosphokinase [Bacteroidia bacterium]